MTHAELRSLALAVLAIFLAIVLSACETAPAIRHAQRALPSYEPPIAKNEFQSVKTTAYTHTEADHTAYSNRNALGGTLQAASRPNRRAENTRGDLLDRQQFGLVSKTKKKTSKEETTTVTEKKIVIDPKTHKKKTITVKKTVKKAQAPKIGSAAADWSRWPAGTTFRVLSTGQTYRIDDYGWALSGRNTIDLYMATPGEMNAWGARHEKIQVLKWGDRDESRRLLQPHADSRHIRRMLLEMDGLEQEAAALN